MNQQQLDTLILELCDQDAPHVMVVHYDNAEVHGDTVNCYSSLGLAVSAFYSLLLPDHHHFLQDGHYLAQWLETGEFDQVNHLLIDVIMGDLPDQNIDDLGFTLVSIYSQEEYEFLNASPDNHGTSAPPLPDLPLADAPSYAIDITRESTALNGSPPAQLLEGDMPSTSPVDLEDIIMFDHEVPPPGVPFMVNGDYTLMDEDARAQLWMPIDFQDPPLFAEPTPGPVPAPNPAPAPRPSTSTNAPSSVPVEIRDLRVSLDARRVFHCNFPGCGSSLTRISDLRRHWRVIHRGHRQT